ARLLEFVSRIQEQIPGEPQTLPVYVEMSARTGKRDDAEKAIRAALDKSAPLETLRRLLVICRAQNLSDDLVDQLGQRIGPRETTSPAFALSHAVELARAGKSGEGLESLAKAAAAATTQPAQWQLAVARYRDM